MTILYDTFGRQGIGVVQPQSGTDYPFVAPSEDVRYLLADFYLSYDDPSDYPGGPVAAFKLPFRIAWIRGFGDAASSSSAPGHDTDLLVVDADGETVFDSTEAVYDEDLAPNSGYAARAWGTRLRIHEWKTEDAVCRLVAHTKWSDDTTPIPREYLSTITPENGVLDTRTIRRLPKRVRTLQALFNDIERTAVDFVAGYNMQMAVSSGLLVYGGRAIKQIAFNAVPGAGAGVYPGCTPQALQLRMINGVRPNDGGDFWLAATDCYWARQPMTIVSASPRRAYPSALLDPTYLTAQLQLGADCPPCCPCEDFVVTANYMNTTRDQYTLMGQTAEGVRDDYHTARDRWNTARLCFMDRPLRLSIQAQVCPYIDIGLQLVNQTSACMRDVVLTLDLSASTGTGVIVPGYCFIRGLHTVVGRQASALERFVPDGAWPTYTASWDYVPSTSAVSAIIRLVFDDCGIVDGAAAVVEAVLTGTASGVPIVSVAGTETGDLTPASVSDSRALRCPGTEDDIVDLSWCVLKEIG